jgi:hypothetical protein
MDMRWSTKDRTISSMELPNFARDKITEDLPLRIGIAEMEQLASMLVARASTASKIDFGTPPASSMITSTLHECLGKPGRPLSAGLRPYTRSSLPMCSTISRLPTVPMRSSASSPGLPGSSPELSIEIKRVVGEGDIVVTHGLIKTSTEDPGTVAADFFRLEDGKIVEHWDVLQPFPETSASDLTEHDDDRRECLDKLLCLAEDPREAAANRQDALKAARNLVVSQESSVKSMIFQASQRFVSGQLDGSAYDELTGPAHPLSAVQISIGTATLRGDGLRLAAAVAETDVERSWVREQALGLLQAQESSLVHNAAVALSELPRTSIDQIDANLLAAHDHFGVRQLAAVLSIRHPGRYRSTALRLAEDKDPRVRRTLAEAAARAGTAAVDDVRDVLAVLVRDNRYSVRLAATRRALA